MQKNETTLTSQHKNQLKIYKIYRRPRSKTRNHKMKKKHRQGKREDTQLGFHQTKKLLNSKRKPKQSQYPTEWEKTFAHYI